MVTLIVKDLGMNAYRKAQINFNLANNAFENFYVVHYLFVNDNSLRVKDKIDGTQENLMFEFFHGNG